MKTQIHLLLLAASLFAVAVSPLPAQVVNDGATNTLSNVTNTITGDVTVGTNGSFTLLTLADNALLTNSAHGVIGRNATAKSNEVRLVSATARWRVGGDLSVGSNGAMSRLVVSNGAWMENNIGSLAAGVQSSNNFALVTGSGSLWSNRSDVIVGWFGRDNQMVVTNGGRVVNLAGGTIGSQVSAPGNVATVTGNGSVWNAGSALTVGYLAANNRLVIEAGGRVDCGTGRVGYNTGSNNLALVTGAGSTWSNVDLQIGGFALDPQRRSLCRLSRGPEPIGGEQRRRGGRPHRLSRLLLHREQQSGGGERRRFGVEQPAESERGVGWRGQPAGRE